MMFAMPLGMIPDWQFSRDPLVNIKINPFVKIPADFTHGQQTIQPIGWFAPQTYGDPLAATNGLTQMNGLGITMASWQQPRAGLGAFESFAWRNRKWLVLGGVSLLGLGIIAGAGALLR